MQLIYDGDFSRLAKLGYNKCKYDSYFFKTIDRWGAVFVDINTRKITIEGCAVDSRNAILELDKIEDYIKEV